MDYGKKKEPEFLCRSNLMYLIDKWGSYSADNLYLTYFNRVPSYYTFGELDLEKFHKEFAPHFNKFILAYHYQKFNLREDYLSDFYYVLENEIIVRKDKDEVIVYFSNEHSNLIKEILNFTRSYRKEAPDKAHINLIISHPHGFENTKIKFKKPELDLQKVYNEGFEVFHQKMLQVLQEENKSGLHLLYGKPGTGKSTYIRYLCSLVKKKIVFLPGQMAQNLDNVEMIKYLMRNQNSILVIEDAEELIISREQKRNSNLAMILNLTDGILGESLGIQIIATFNTDVKNLDPALKRKGRLKTAYEFKALTAEKANVLLQEQNPGCKATGEMTLAEIYNITEEEQYREQERKAVGFK